MNDTPAYGELGSAALDFLHTLRRTRGGVTDLLSTPGDLLAWLGAHPETAMLTAVPVSIPEARTLLDEARRLRAAIAALVESRASGGEASAASLYGINRVLRAGRWVWSLEAVPGGLTLGTRTEEESALRLLVPIALAAARLATTVEASRLRSCASPTCGAWFLDTSKGGRRKWCSMARCGNRAKAAAHRVRSRAT